MFPNLRRTARIFSALTCITVLAVSLLGCGGGGDAKGRIVGTVYDGDPSTTNRTASGVKVIVFRYVSTGTELGNKIPVADATSDQQGHFVVSVPDGSYGVYADNGYSFVGASTTYCTFSRDANVTSGQTTTVSLGYESCSGAVN